MKFGGVGLLFMYHPDHSTLVAAAAADSPAHGIKRDVIIHREHAVVDVLVV